MKRHIFSFFLVLFLLFNFLYGFQKQKKLLKPLKHEVTVELIVVEVFVTDKKGNFVDNLKKDDFEIYEDGKKVKIQYFNVIKPERDIKKEEIIEKIKPLPPQKMKLVILFDGINTNRLFLYQNWPKIKEMFKGLLEKIEEAMIIEINREAGMRIIQPFTSNQGLLANKLSELRFDLWKEIEKFLRKHEMEDFEVQSRLSLENFSRVIGNPGYLKAVMGEEERFKRRRRLSDSFSAFLAAVNYIRRYDGVKSVLIVSDGFRIEKGLIRLFDPFKVFGGKKYFDQREAFEKFLKLISEEKIIFYAFSPKGLKTDFSVTEPAYLYREGRMFRDEMEQWSKELYSIEKIAEETGGVFLKGEEKYQDFIKELERDLTHFYDISYTPPKRERKGGYHKVEVKVKKPGVIVRHKRGYTDFTEEELEKKNIVSAFLSPSSFKDITFSCNTDFIALNESYPQFWVRLAIPLSQFRDEYGIGLSEKLALMFGIREAAGERVHFGETEFRIKDSIEKGLDTLYHAFITSAIKLKPGEYETRVILKQTGDRIGGWESSLRIPDTRKEAPLSIINSIFCFLRKEKRENIVPFTVSLGDGSLLLSKYRLYPTVTNIFKQESKVALFLQIYDLRNIRDFSLRFSLHRDEDMIFSLPHEKIESQFDKESKILNEVYLLDFKDVFPGDYQLKIKSTDLNIEKQIEIKIVSLFF